MSSRQAGRQQAAAQSGREAVAVQMAQAGSGSADYLHPPARQAPAPGR